MSISTVIIVGAGPSGLATAACLTKCSIPYILLEKDDCYASLWKKKAYDRLHLHLSKTHVQLPYVNVPKSYPVYISKNEFIEYLDNYVDLFDIKPLYRRQVEGARFENETGRWRVVARNGGSGEMEEYVGRFLVVASGESSVPFCAEIDGLESFTGKVMHTTEFRNGKGYNGKSVLVVGCGNSGMEIALDLANHGAKPFIVARSPVHIISRGMGRLALFLFQYLPHYMVDKLLVILSKLVYGNISKYGFSRPSLGPFDLIATLGKYPIIDVGTFAKIKSGAIQVLPGVTKIRGNDVGFEDGRSFIFDVIILATGFRRATNQWLQGDDYLLSEDGLSKVKYPDHWKGKNGLYCVGLNRKGIYGLSADAENVAKDIKSLL